MLDIIGDRERDLSVTNHSGLPRTDGCLGNRFLVLQLEKSQANEDRCFTLTEVLFLEAFLKDTRTPNKITYAIIANFIRCLATEINTYYF